MESQPVFEVLVTVKVSIYARLRQDIYFRACLSPDGEVRLEMECR